MFKSRTAFKLCLSSALLVFSFGFASATETFDMKAGQSITTKFAVWDSSNCQAGPYPEVQFKQPANGKITTRRGRAVEPEGTPCAGKNLPGVFVTYKPNKGFKGKECGAISLVFPEYVSGGGITSKRYDICINVK